MSEKLGGVDLYTVHSDIPPRHYGPDCIASSSASKIVGRQNNLIALTVKIKGSQRSVATLRRQL